MTEFLANSNGAISHGLATLLRRRLRPNYSFNATVTCRGDNPAPGAAR
jgi:hypothetical protein